VALAGVGGVDGGVVGPVEGECAVGGAGDGVVLVVDEPVVGAAQGGAVLDVGGAACFPFPEVVDVDDAVGASGEPAVLPVA
jgi:hypothetical protein